MRRNDEPDRRLRALAALAALATATALLAAAPAPRLAPPPKLPQLVAWNDPLEHAFTVRVPAGWRIEGGTRRNSPIDARNYVVAHSPDGSITAYVDAPGILPRQEPHPAYYALGWYEGRVVQSQAGPLAIERFKSGAQFAREFASTQVCRGAEAEASFDLPAATSRINAEIAPLAARAGARAQASAGEFVYHCGARSGYDYAVTVEAFTTPGGPRNWAVYKLAGYVSNRADLDLARYVMNAMVASLQLDPAWQAAYERQIHDTTGALMAMSDRITRESIQRAQQSLQQNMAMVQRRQQEFDQISAMRQSSFQRQQESQSRIAQRWSDITLGQVHGCDDLGRCATVSNEYQYHWVDKSGNVVPGPSDGSAPGPGYHTFTPDS